MNTSAFSWYGTGNPLLHLYQAEVLFIPRHNYGQSKVFIPINRILNGTEVNFIGRNLYGRYEEHGEHDQEYTHRAVSESHRLEISEPG